MSVKHKLDLFDKFSLPILNYGSQIWGLLDSHVLENIHLKYCKKLLGNKTNLSMVNLRGHL
jgi:hypothetical protein